MCMLSDGFPFGISYISESTGASSREKRTDKERLFRCSTSECV